MITKEWCKEYALINQGLNADNIFPITWSISANADFYPHMIVGDTDTYQERLIYSSWGTLINITGSAPTLDVSKCAPSVQRAALDSGQSLNSVSADSFKCFNFLINTLATDAWFIPAGAHFNAPVSYASFGNFERLGQIVNNGSRKSTAYVFPYVCAGNLSVSGTSVSDIITLTNQDTNRISGSTISTNKFGQNRVFQLTETLDYVPCVFDAIKLGYSTTKSVTFVGYAIQKQATSWQTVRGSLFTEAVIP